MQEIRLLTYGDESDVEALTDCVVAESGQVLLLSLVGNQSIIDSLSSHLLAKAGRSTVNYLQLDQELGYSSQIHRGPKAHYKIQTTKLAPGLAHQLVIDDRFFDADEDSGVKLVLLGPDDDAATVVYNTVIREIPTPTLPEWAQTLYDHMLVTTRSFYDRGHAAVRIFEGYPTGTRVAWCRVTENQLDRLVSQLVREGEISW